MNASSKSGIHEASAEQYADVFASTAEGIVLIDREGNLVFANPRAYEIAGYSKRELAADEIWRALHPDDRPRMLEYLQGFRDGAYPREVDMRLVRSDGTVIVCSLSFARLSTRKGATVVSFRDVTRYRRTEEELLKTMHFLESLIETSVGGIIATDMDGRVILYNPSAQSIHGYTTDEVVGRLTLNDLYAPESVSMIMKGLPADTLGGIGRIAPTRLDAIDHKNQQVPVELSAAFVYEHGTPAAIVLMFTDLRERVRAEERLVEAQRRLEFSEQQAVLAELAGTAAHELNQPLTSMMAYGEMLKKRAEEGSFAAKAAVTMLEEAERMAKIVKKIGRITHYETTSYVGSQRIFDLERASVSEPPPDDSSKR